MPNSIGYFKLSHFEPKTISFLSFSSLLLAISKFFFFSFPLRVQNKSNYRATIKPGWKKMLMVVTFNCQSIQSETKSNLNHLVITRLSLKSLRSREQKTDISINTARGPYLKSLLDAAIIGDIFSKCLLTIQLCNAQRM